MKQPEFHGSWFTGFVCFTVTWLESRWVFGGARSCDERVPLWLFTHFDLHRPSCTWHRRAAGQKNRMIYSMPYMQLDAVLRIPIGCLDRFLFEVQVLLSLMFVDSLYDNVRMLKHAKTSGPWKTSVQVSLATSLHLGQRCSSMVRHCEVFGWVFLKSCHPKQGPFLIKLRPTKTTGTCHEWFVSGVMSRFEIWGDQLWSSIQHGILSCTFFLGVVSAWYRKYLLDIPFWWLFGDLEKLRFSRSLRGASACCAFFFRFFLFSMAKENYLHRIGRSGRFGMRPKCR